MMNHTDQDKNVTNISNICLSPDSDKVYLAVTHVAVLVPLNIFILIGSFVANALAILVILKTNKLSNTAFKLMFNLSLAGIGHTIFGQAIFLITLINDVSCLVQYIGQFVLLFCGYTPVCTIGAIWFDRYLRVQYKTKYGSILTRKRVHILIFLIYCFALARLSVALIAFLFEKSEFIKLLGSVLDFLLMFVIALQMTFVIAIRKISRSSNNQEVMKDINKTIIKSSSRIKIVFLIFCTTSATMLVIYNMLKNTVTRTGRKTIEFMKGLGCLIAHINSFANAIL